MAGKNGRSAGKTTIITENGRAKFVGYVNVTLTEKDAEDFKGWFSQSDIVADSYLDLFDKGYQITLKFDNVSDCFLASLSNWHPEAVDSGVIYTARSGTVEGAIWKAVFVWDRVLSRNLNNGNVKGAMRDAF